MRLAKTHASQKLLYVDRYENRTIFHNFYEEFYYTKVYAEKKPQGKTSYNKVKINLSTNM